MYEFKGWDYTELGYCWGIINKDMDDQEAGATIENYLSKIGADGMGASKNSEERKVLQSVANDIREFLKVLSQYKTYEAPVWKGMLKVKSDWTLVKFTINNFYNMWT